MAVIPRFITVNRLMRDFGLPWQRAEAIIRDQTIRNRCHPLAVSCYLGGFLVGGIGVPMLVPRTHHALAMMLRLGCLAVMVSGLLLVRVLARQAILDAATAERCRGG